MLSRTADTLFWLGRYVERADNTARIIDAANRLATVPDTLAGETSEWEPALAAAGALYGFKQGHDEVDRDPAIDYLAFSPDNLSSIKNCVGTARNNARAVRTALTSEMWEAINEAWQELKRYDGTKMDRQTLNGFLSGVKEACLRFDGSAYRTMLRHDAYWFLRLGFYLERADSTARILDVKYHVLLPEEARVGGGLDYFQWSSILRSVSALTAYRWVYHESLKPWLIADLLVLNDQMPRSLASCYENLTLFLDELALAYGRQGPAQRAARSTMTRLQNAEISEIFQNKGLHEFLTEFIAENARLGETIAKQYLT
ncbi:MAG: alpha-E domain-containing protein [Bauldia sp.]|uniref:alpha-E domain-containing protein n=1 Tax=Bauldia sp. TaxID=2575872 RepID=UPI001DD9A903|nr:alpha-E domain-containing protein [Bauldia sp.]MCB1496613.1 alpha-E domain-containing protein [Bauldia sp.]